MVFVGIVWSRDRRVVVLSFSRSQLGPASLVAPIDKLSVVFVALMAFVFLGERLSVTSWLGVLAIGAGAVMVAIG